MEFDRNTYNNEGIRMDVLMAKQIYEEIYLRIGCVAAGKVRA